MLRGRRLEETKPMNSSYYDESVPLQVLHGYSSAHRDAISLWSGRRRCRCRRSIGRDPNPRRGECENPRSCKHSCRSIWLPAT